MNRLPEAISLLMTDALASAKLDFELRLASGGRWRDLEGKTEYFPVDYSLPVTEFALAQGLEVRPVYDVSLILLHDNRPCGLWPLSLAHESDDRWTLGSNGGLLLPPVFLDGFEAKSTKTIVSRCISFVFDLCRRLGQSEFGSVERLVDKAGLGEWYNRLLLNGSSVTVQHDLYLDLEPPLEKVRSGFRKSYKPLISSGERLWKVGLVASENQSVWERFMRLHEEVSGRMTRAKETWETQHAAIARGEAFLVTLENAEGRMVGGGYFVATPHEGVYGSGAYDRALFDKPLGHVVQWHAIQELKRRGVCWYKLGRRAYLSDGPGVSEKEISISNFKQGFASHLFPSFRIGCKVGQAENLF